MPGIGAPRPDVADGLRIAPVGNYRILYMEENGGADVLRVIHGARDRANWL
jgi:toxin ParE1/3/4